MTNVILVWEQIPESTKVYSLMLSDDEVTRLRRCNSKFINCDDFDGDDQDWLVKFGDERLSEDYQVYPADTPLDIVVNGVLIVTGWVL